jgi:pyruvate dehydrogenase E2 component (dihydrolipoamide acetyltransferase)
MATEVRLPQLGKTMEEGTIIKCLVKVGDKVSRGDILFELETDKATVEMESPDSGFVKAILVQPGQAAAVHQTLLVLGDKYEQVSQDFLDSIPKKIDSKSVETIPATGNSPAVVTNSEIAGAVSSSDMQGQYELGQVFPLGRLQKLTGQRMLQSKQRIPCFYLTARADVTGLVEYREKINRQSEPKVSYNDFIIRAAATGLKRFEIMTGQLEGQAIKLPDSIGVGLAISVPGGVVAPVVKDADKKDVRQIAYDTTALIERAQKGKLSPDDLEGGCITVSNLGAFGVESFIPVVLPGQCSILGIGAIIDTPVPAASSRDESRGGRSDVGNMVIRKLMNITICVDHRITNGAYAGQFLDYLRKLLEDASSFD